MKWQTERKAETSEEVRARHLDNREAWNQGASHYTQANQQRVAKLRAGTSNLHPIERDNLARLGPLKQWCQRAIHLQCASGYDSLSLLLEGAGEVIGVDISDVHIENARGTSDQLGLPASWYCCDLLDTPAELNGTADLVYTGRGALCWNHDIQAWARVVARLLKPGAVLSLLDDHPASWLFVYDSPRLTCSGLDYFRHAESNQGWPQEYIGDLGKAPEQHALKHERLWPLAEIFQALVAAGLVVEYLGEHNTSYWDAFPKLSQQDKQTLPQTFSMIARKPR